MTADKMLRILERIRDMPGVKLKGVWIGTTAGNELALDFNTQLSVLDHVHMLARGFIYTDSRYVYRPR